MIERYKADSAWTIELSNPLNIGLDPVLDPFEPYAFYIGDGWGSSFPSMKLRKLSLLDGAEIASAYVKSPVRCLHFEPDGGKLMAAGDNKWFGIDRRTMQVEVKYEEKIAKYCDFISSDGFGNYVAMNYRTGWLNIYDTNSRIGRKRKLGSCGGIVPADASTFLIFLPLEGQVAHYDLAQEAVIRLRRFSTFKQALISRTGKIYLWLGRRALQANTNAFVDPVDKMVIYDNLDAETGLEIDLPANVVRFFLANDDERIYFAMKDRLVEYSIRLRKAVKEYAFANGFQIITCFSNLGKVLLGSREDRYKTISLAEIV